MQDDQPASVDFMRTEGVSLMSWVMTLALIKSTGVPVADFAEAFEEVYGSMSVETFPGPILEQMEHLRDLVGRLAGDVPPEDPKSLRLFTLVRGGIADK